MNKEIDLVVNTPAGKLSQHDDSYIRKAVIKYKVPYITTMPAALAAAKGIAERRSEHTQVRSLQDYHRNICRPFRSP
jgi:carbamoyl-phosphate synthase large subunit